MGHDDMRKIILALTSIAILSCDGLIYAGEIEPIQSPWKGFYLGVNGGYTWSNASTSVTPLPTPAQLPAHYLNIQPTDLTLTMSGGLLGGQLGYNYRCSFHPNWILGLETDIDWIPSKGSIDGNATGNAAWDYTVLYNIISTHQSTTWFGTLRPRLGYIFNDFLVYGTGGLAYGNMKESANINYAAAGYGNEAYPYSTNSTNTGWTVGGGFEWTPKKQWSAKVEYLYYDLGTVSGIANPVPENLPYQAKYTWSNPAQIIRLGINHYFN